MSDSHTTENLTLSVEHVMYTKHDGSFLDGHLNSELDFKSSDSEKNNFENHLSEPPDCTVNSSDSLKTSNSEVLETCDNVLSVSKSKSDSENLGDSADKNETASLDLRDTEIEENSAKEQSTNSELIDHEKLEASKIICVEETPNPSIEENCHQIDEPSSTDEHSNGDNSELTVCTSENVLTENEAVTDENYSEPANTANNPKTIFKISESDEEDPSQDVLEGDVPSEVPTAVKIPRITRQGRVDHTVDEGSLDSKSDEASPRLSMKTVVVVSEEDRRSMTQFDDSDDDEVSNLAMKLKSLNTDGSFEKTKVPKADPEFNPTARIRKVGSIKDSPFSNLSQDDAKKYILSAGSDVAPLRKAFTLPDVQKTPETPGVHVSDRPFTYLGLDDLKNFPHADIKEAVISRESVQSETVQPLDRYSIDSATLASSSAITQQPRSVSGLNSNATAVQITADNAFPPEKKKFSCRDCCKCI